MEEELTIDGDVENSAIVLTVRYSPELLIKLEAGKQFSQELVKRVVPQ